MDKTCVWVKSSVFQKFDCYLCFKDCTQAFYNFNVNIKTWWRHQMEAFRVTGHLCGEFTGPGEFPAQRPVTLSFDVFVDLKLTTDWVNKREAGDLRCYHTHYDVIVMKVSSLYWCTKMPLGYRVTSNQYVDYTISGVFGSIFVVWFIWYR